MQFKHWFSLSNCFWTKQSAPTRKNQSSTQMCISITKIDFEQLKQRLACDVRSTSYKYYYHFFLLNVIFFGQVGDSL